MSQHPSRRAALAAAVVGVLLAVTASLGFVLTPTGATTSAAVSGTAHASVAAALSQVEPSALARSHPASIRTAGLDRSSGGLGYAVAASALLVLALLALVAAAATTWRRPASVTRTAHGPRAPPALVTC